MKDEDKSKRQLIEELVSLRQQVAELKTLEAERKRAEEALRLSEIRFRSLVEQTTDAVFCYEYDPPIPTKIPLKGQVAQFYQGVLVECNDVCARSYGATRAEEVIGKKLPELYGTTPGSLDGFFTAFIANGYRTVDAKDVEVFDDGTKRYFLNNGHGVVENGMLLRVWGTFQDITERKWAEEALREAKEFSESLITAMQDGFSVLDTRGVHIDVNPALCQMTGFSREELIGTGPPHPYWPPEGYEEIERAFQQALRGEFGDFELTFMRKNGERFPVIVSPSWIKDGQENVISYFATIKDITERKQAEEVLNEARARLQHVLATSPAIIYSCQVDPEGQPEDGYPPTFVSQNFTEAFGYETGECLDNPKWWTECIHPEDAPQAFAEMAALFEQGHLVHEYRFRHKDGSYRWVHDALVLVHDASGKPVEFVGSWMDITERKQVENELKERLRFEELLSELSARFINLEVNQINIEIERAFENIGTDFDIDRIVLWELSRDKQQYHISHSWSVAGIGPIRITLSTDSFPYIKKKLLSQGESFMFSSVEEIPEEAIAEKRYYDQQGIKSSLVIPLTVAGDVIGGLSLSTIHVNRNWPAGVVQRLLLLGEILSNALIRKKIDEALRESEGRLSSFMNSASDSLYLLDSDLNFVEINEKGLEIIGKSREEVIGKNITDIVPDVKESGRYEKHLEVIRTGQPYVIEDFVPHPVFGGLHFVLKSFKVGEGLGVIASDITERKRAEETLREREEMIRALVETSQDWIWSIDVQGIHTYCNPAVEAILGYRPEELVGQPSLDLIHAEDRVQIEASLPGWIKEKRGWNNQLIRWQHKDGSYRYLESNAVPMLNAAGELIGFRGVDRDITERKQAEEVLQEGERRYRLLIENIPTVAWVTSRDGKTIFISANVEKVYGYSADEILDVGEELWFGRIHPKDKDRVKDAFELLFSKQRPFDVEYRIQRKDGQWIWLQDRANIVEEKDGHLYAYGVFSDITERKQAEEALHNYTERLRILHEIDQGILTAQSPEAIAQVAVTHTRQLVPCHRVGVALFDFTTNEAIALAVDADLKTKVKKGARVQLDQFEHSEKDVNALQQGQIIIHKEFQPQEELSEAIYAEEARSLITVPLMSRGELIGSLNLTLTEPDEFPKEYEDIARQVADQLAIAIQQARLHEQVERHAAELEQRVAERTRELSALYEVTAIASQPLDLKTMLAQSLERVLAAMKSHAGAIHLLDEGNETRHLAVQQGLPSDSLPQLESLPAHQGPGGWVIEHGKPLIVSDITADPRMIVTSPQVVPRTYVGVPMRASGQVLGVLSVLRETTQPQFSEEELTLLTSLADQVGAVVESHRLRQVAEQAAIMEERQRLARDLHDSVTQSLYSLTLLAETGRRSAIAGDLESVVGYLERLGEVAQQSLKEMRLLVYELRPLALEREGLVGALQQRLDTVEGRAGVETRLLVEEEIELAAPVEEALYRIALEALNNALKHAAATSVTVRIQADDDCIKSEIIDNGQGFDPQAISDMGGMGLVTMRERAEQLGGTLTVLSAPGEGTTIKVKVEWRYLND